MTSRQARESPVGTAVAQQVCVQQLNFEVRITWISLAASVPKGANVEEGVDKVKPETLLIVDDDEEWTDLLRVFFSRKYEVYIANSANEAIESIQTKPPRAIILDLVMPSVDGFGFMHRVGEMDLGEVPTVLITGWDSAAVAECAASVGCAAVLSKPISLDVLDRVVAGLMDGESGKLQPVKP